MTTKLAKGTPLVSLADGAKLGVIDAVLLDPVQKRIVGVSFHQGGGLLGGRTSGMVDVSDVHAIGADVVTVSGGSAVFSEIAVQAKRDGLVDLEDLLKREVVTAGGALLGKIAGVHFDLEGYALTALEVASGPFQAHCLIDAERIAQIGGELVVVADEADAPAAEPAAAEPFASTVYLVPKAHRERTASAS